MRRYFALFILVQFALYACTPATPAESDNQPPTDPVFHALPPTQTGITFTNHVEENYTNFFARFQYVYNGGGVAIGDLNGDDRPDLYFTANEGEDKLYLNDGNLQFTDATTAAGTTDNSGWNSGVTLADVDGDGHLDIYVCRGGSADEPRAEIRANLLYRNNGDGTFTESAAAFGLDDRGYSLQAAFFDFDNDNDLDVYVTNRPNRFFLPYPEVLEAKKEQDPAFSDRLYRNDGGSFTDVTTAAGITGNFGYGLGLVTADLNGDGFQDILVSNDYLENDYLYLNQGDGTFRESIAEATNHTAFYGMGIDVADLNNDGLEDIIQLDMSPEDYKRSKTTMASMNVDRYREIMASGFHDQYMHNMLQLNRGGGRFSEISQLAGTAKTDWSWACLGADFDNDGRREIFVSNGYRRDVADKDANIRMREYMNGSQVRTRTNEENAAFVIDMFNSVPLQNYLFDGEEALAYHNRAATWGLDEKTFSNGAAYGDLDGDGDLDLVVNNLESAALVYENTNPGAGSHLRLRLTGPAGNRYGLGAKILVEQTDGRQYQEMRTTRGYLSSVEPVAHFGFAPGAAVKRVTVTWPDGKQSVIEQPTLNQVLTVDYSTAREGSGRERVVAATLFEDITDRYFAEPVVYEENEFDEYQSQILLPHGFSHEGPALAVADVNGDGKDDLFVGGAKKKMPRILLGGEGSSASFQVHAPAFAQKEAAFEDGAATFFDVDSDGDQDLYVVSGGSEFPPGSRYFQDRLYLNDGSGAFTRSNLLPEITSSGGCVRPYDMDGDGDLDLFVGGKVVPANYPSAPRSYLLERTEKGFVDVTNEKARGLAYAGMVKDAAWSDTNGDGRAELIVVGEWMPVMVFAWQDGILVDGAQERGLGQTQGWWNRVLAHDLDGDGRDEYVLGNLGLNYKFHASPDHPFYVFATDFDRNGTNDIFLAKETDDRLVPIRGRECSSQQLPSVKQKFPTYGDFAEADIGEIIETDREDAVRYEARQFASSLLRFGADGKAELRPLPLEAQFSIVNDIVAADFNGDGRTDLLLAGNKFDVEIETTRADAGLGTLLLGAADGTFSPAPAGLDLRQNVRALCPIELADGSAGIVVGINDGPLRLLRSPKPLSR